MFCYSNVPPAISECLSSKAINLVKYAANNNHMMDFVLFSELSMILNAQLASGTKITMELQPLPRKKKAANIYRGSYPIPHLTE